MFSSIRVSRLALVILTVTLLVEASRRSDLGERKHGAARKSTVPESLKRVPKSPVSSGKRNEEDRISAGTKRTATTFSRIKTAAKSTQPAEGDSGSKFQARMMDTEPRASNTHSNVQAGPPSGGNSYFVPQDSWQAHSLVPTFTDQEQGDEMIALASEGDSATVEQVKPRSALKVETSLLKNAKSQPTSFKGVDKTRSGSKNDHSRGPSNKQRVSNDEYENDDDDDSEEYDAPKLREELDGRDLRGQIYKLGGREREPQQVDAAHQNKTDARRPSVGGWLPTAGLADFVGNDNAPAQEQAPKRELGDLSIAQQVSDGSRRQPRGRLADLVGGRESFGSALSRTDAAIEYLKGILKNKQSRSNSSETESARLPAVSADMSRIKLSLNETKIEGEAAKSQQPKPSPPLELDSKGQTASQASAKFSISDAKSFDRLIGFTFSTPSSLVSQAQQTSNDERRQTNSRVDRPRGIALNPDQLLNPLGVDLAMIGQPNGTPVGGDYVESQDEFPRGPGSNARQQQHFAPGTLQPSRSYPNKQQQPHQESLQQQEAHPELRSELESQIATMSSSQIEHFAQQSSEFQPIPRLFPSSRPSNEQQGLKPQDMPHLGFPTSSRYFQMHQMVQPNQHSKTAEPNRAQTTASFSHNVSHPPTEIDLKHPNPNSQAEKPMLSAPVFNKSDVIAAVEVKEKTEEIHNLPSPPPMKSDVSHQNTSEAQPIKAFADQAHYVQQHPSGIQIPLQVLPDVQHPTNDQANMQPRQKLMKPPRLVSYNYFESSNEPGESELMATNYQLGDALLSSGGGIEQVLSSAEMDAIQSQFINSDHQIVPLPGQPLEQPSQHQQPAQEPHQHDSGPQDANLAGLLASLKPEGYSPESLQKLNQPAQQTEEAMRALASSEDPTNIALPQTDRRPSMPGPMPATPFNHPDENKKRKSLVVYLNHPRSTDMTKEPSSDSSEDPTIESLVAAKEFDSHGLSKNNKHLDISSLADSDYPELKEGSPDKDGLSVVVIGDAYKYKKIVLLISSKTGGLKFIPIVKDMKR